MKRFSFRIILLLLCLCLGGCDLYGMEVENKLRAPLLGGEQEYIQKALESYISSIKLSRDYLLKYPREGDHRSAIIVRDLDGDGVDEAVAFYQTFDAESDGRDGRIHVNLLRKSAGNWKSVSDSVKDSPDIEYVTFCDLDGDRAMEMLVGWEMSGTTDYELVLYSIRSNQWTEQALGSCAGMAAAPLPASQRDVVLTFTADAVNGAQVSLWQHSGSALENVRTVQLNPAIQSFRNLRVETGGSMPGVFADGVLANGMTTEWIVYGDGQLTTPFYDSATGTSLIETFRKPAIATGDYDMDGIYEWPLCIELPGYYTQDPNITRKNTYEWLTSFYHYDAELNTSSRVFSCIFNQADGYYLSVEDEWFTRITAAYEAENRLLRLYTWEDGVRGDCVMEVMTTPLTADTSGSAGIPDGYTEVAQNQGYRYSIRYSAGNDLGINSETALYILTLITSA